MPESHEHLERLRNWVAYHLAALDASVAPYADRPEVQEFQEEARRMLEMLPRSAERFRGTPGWVERSSNWLRDTVGHISLNCRILQFGYNPPGRDPHAWNVLAEVVGMEEFDRKDNMQVYRFLVKLEAKAIAEDAVERRRTRTVAPAQPAEKAGSPLFALAQAVGLVGKQLALVRMIAAADGPVPLGDIGLELGWFLHGQRSWEPSNNDSWSNLQTAVNKKLRPHGWKIRRLNSSAEAVRIEPMVEKQ